MVKSKPIFFLYLLIVGNCTWAQQSLKDLVRNRVWVGEHNNYLKIDWFMIQFEHFSKEKGNVRIQDRNYFRNDTLKLIGRDSLMNTNFLVYYDPKIERLTLTPVTAAATLFTDLATGSGIKKQLVFKDQNRVYTDTIKFEKLIWNTNCNGNCPEESLEINNKREMRFIGHNSSTKQGYFKSKISKELYADLIEILRKAELDKWTGSNYRHDTAITYTLEIHYNGKVKFLQTSVLPMIVEKLWFYLNRLPVKTELIAVMEKFDIIFSKK